MKGFKAGNNEIQSRPRVHVLLKVDLKMIAEAAGVSKKTITRAINNNVLDVSDLRSITEYIQGRLNR